MQPLSFQQLWIRSALSLRRVKNTLGVSAVGLLLGACQTAPSPKGTELEEAESSAGSTSALSAEREVRVRESEQEEKLARETKGEAALSHWKQAAVLREAAYRVEGRQVDAQAAFQLWVEASRVNEVADCETQRGLLRTRFVLHRAPEQLYRDAYVLRHVSQEESCVRAWDTALQLLSSFEPSPQELTELRKSAQKTNVTSSASAEEHAHVIVPESLIQAMQGPTEITQVDAFPAEQTARLVIHVTHPTKFRLGALQAQGGQGPRLFVDIENASYQGPSARELTGLVEGLRIGKQKQGTRVVLDLRETVFHRAFYLPDPFRLVLDLSVRSPEKLTRPREIRRVVLDPGHGGHDPGAVANNGLMEKDVTLDVAHRAAPLLAREVGVSTLLTRDVDVYVPLHERAARANAFHADLFISIHFNSSENSSSRGVMTFVLDASRDTTAAQIAARENASTAAAAAELANHLSRMESADRRAASELFAGLLQRAAGVSLRQNYPEVEDHGVRRAGFYVLAGATMPAVLFEGAFLSNAVEADRLNTEEYRQRLSDAIVNAVRAYREGL